MTTTITEVSGKQVPSILSWWEYKLVSLSWKAKYVSEVTKGM